MQVQHAQQRLTGACPLPACACLMWVPLRGPGAAAGRPSSHASGSTTVQLHNCWSQRSSIARRCQMSPMAPCISTQIGSGCWSLVKRRSSQAMSPLTCRCMHLHPQLTALSQGVHHRQLHTAGEALHARRWGMWCFTRQVARDQRRPLWRWAAGFCAQKAVLCIPRKLRVLCTGRVSWRQVQAVLLTMQLCTLAGASRSPHLLPRRAGVGEPHRLPPVAGPWRCLPLHLVVSQLAACTG